jgi:hypothetical protein
LKLSFAISSFPTLLPVVLIDRPRLRLNIPASGKLVLTCRKDHHPFPRTVALPLQHNQSVSVPTVRRGLGRQLILACFFESLACQAVFDLKVFVLGRVAQHLEARILGVEFHGRVVWSF